MKILEKDVGCCRMVTILSVVIFYGVKKINTRSENMKDN